MKTDKGRSSKLLTGVSLVIAISVLCVTLATGVFAEDGVTATNSTEASYEIEDTNPAIYVAKRNADSVVGVITNVQMWNNSTRETATKTYSEGSGVVIADGGYILTNYHVVSSGDTYQVLLPSGEKVDAALVGYDSSYDLAVLKVDSEYAGKLVPAAIGSVDKMYVGSTVIAIGNPGGETLYNTVTNGIISCLSRTVSANNTSRTVEYIQHDAAINSGNSGGGLFDINGNLVGINTLKYGSSSGYSSTAFEGLGFAIPIDTAYPIAVQLIENGKVFRLGVGVNIVAVSGAEEATESQTPAGLYIKSLVADGPAEKSGIMEGDIITAIDGTRITSTQEFTDIIDTHKEGDTVTITVARYTADDGMDDSEDGFTRTSYTTGSSDVYTYNPFGDFFSNPFGGYYDYQQPSYKLEVLDIEVTLEILK